MPVIKRQSASEVRSNLKWFYSEIGKSAKDFSYNSFNIRKDPFIGGVFFFIYDAKHKDTLPYWDRFPLVIPVELYSDGFLGLNLHYVPAFQRILLLNRLRKFKVGTNTDQYMKLSYRMLGSAAKSELFKPCIHRYLSSHLRSRLVQVKVDDWDKVTQLPAQQWQKASPY